MITIKELAKQQSVSYEAVRQQVKRYKKDLHGHISKIGRTQYLDEWAVDFLQKIHQQSPVIVVNQNKAEELERLREENNSLVKQIAILQEKLIKEQENVKLLQQEKIALLEEKPKKKIWQFWKS